MRSLSRLIEVMNTCNPTMPFGFTMGVLARMMQRGVDDKKARKETILLARSIGRRTKSDHFRELAAEAAQHMERLK